MLKGRCTTIDLVKGSNGEYVIKDTIGITIGRIYIIERIKENRFCSCRIRFYKERKKSYETLKDAIRTLVLSMIQNMNIYKVTILAEEDINILSFTDLGFELEGVITSSILSKDGFSSQLVFGIDADCFKNGQKEKEVLIKGSKIELKVLTPENAEELLEYYSRNREHLRNFEPVREESFYTVVAQRHILIESYKQYMNGQSVNLGICKDNKIIGKIQVSNIIAGVFKSAFVGYSIDKDHQGKGYMKEALNLVLKFSYEELNLHRIEASTLVDNIRSQKVLRNCGFKEVGLNEKYLFINGQWRDHVTFYKIQ